MGPKILTILALSALACASVIGVLQSLIHLSKDSTLTFCVPDTQLIGNSTLAPDASCYWDGTAPFCAGGCPAGYDDCGTSSCGDGACCVTGYKKYCCRGECPSKKISESSKDAEPNSGK
ncbi:hypothetical protein RRF57_000721 [Xylaria bambusicola]|uniref:Uncharacterized protein n=1 Tax=Xylaria bambusicola TaxID=326684 RepID=A0AAN7U3Z9_9PEZI